MESRQPRHHAFTLIELLVVISIIALLIAILLPVLQGARESARSVTCLANHRSIGIGMFNYQSDNNAYFPPTTVRMTSGNQWGSVSAKGVTRNDSQIPWYSSRLAGQYFGNGNPCASAFPGELQRPDTEIAYCTNFDDDLSLASFQDLGLGYNNSTRSEFSRFDLGRTLFPHDLFVAPSNTFLTMDVTGTAGRGYLWSRFFRGEMAWYRGDDNATRSYTAYRHLGSTNISFADGSGRSTTDALADYQNGDLTFRARRP